MHTRRLSLSCPPLTSLSPQLRPHLAEAVLQRTKLLKWLLGRIRVKGAADSNKQYASEILSILMQVSVAVSECVCQ